MSPQRRPGVLFDVDGTLLDTNYLHVLAWSQAFVDGGHEGVAMAVIHRAIGIPGAQLVEKILGESDEKVSEAHDTRYEPLRDQVTAFPAAAELLQACKDRGLAVVLATSGPAADLEWMRPAIGAADAVLGSTTSDDVQAGKPAPDLLTTAAEQNDLDPARTAAVGDTIWDVQAAKAAGLPCIALTCGGISAAELRDAGADEVYDDPADLLARLDESLLAGFSGGSQPAED